MTDRELLEAAAKAAGVPCLGFTFDGWVKTSIDEEGSYTVWNALLDDAAAFRLMVARRLDICRPSEYHDSVCVWVDNLSDFIEEPHAGDVAAATRRVIVRAAAALAKDQP